MSGSMGKLVVTYKLDTTPKLTAFTYQQDAVEAIRDLEYSAVFHEQGLGKTKIAIDVALYWLEGDSRHRPYRDEEGACTELAAGISRSCPSPAASTQPITQGEFPTPQQPRARCTCAL